MTPTFDENHKNTIGAKLTRTLGLAVRNGEISREEVPQVAAHILETIDKVTDYPQLIKYLTSLMEKWGFFSSVLIEELSVETEG